MTRKKIFFLSLLFLVAFTAVGAFLFFKDAPRGCGTRLLTISNCAHIAYTPPIFQREQAVSAPEEEIVAPSPASYAAILEKFRGKDVTDVAISEKLIALTFDGGGNSDGAQEILEILSDNGVHATFFLTGNFVEKFPDIAKLIMQNGNEIAHHTATHKNFSEISDEEAAGEMHGMEQKAGALGISVVPFFRFPYGAPTKEKIALVNARGYIAVRWTVDSLGWQGKKEGRDPQFVAARVLGKAKPGAVALMHLGSAGDKSVLDAEALPEIITALKQQGYRLVPLSELFTEAL